MLSFQNIDYSVAGKNLLQQVNFQVSTNQHIGIVGRNGTGKSTIFKMIEGQLAPDQGSIEVAKYWKILSVKQEMPDGHLTPLEFLLAQDTERLALLSELENCEDTDRMGDIYERLIQIDAYSAESRAATILKKLGFDDPDQNRLLSTFSGGFRMRVALAAVLFQEPDLLLLDEPTNHLDLETIQWLQVFLRKYPKSFLLISHDRDFLNNTVDYILHLKHQKISRYGGNFDSFLTTYAMQQENVASQNSKLEERRSKMMEFVNRLGAKASKARQAQSRLKAIAKMQFIPVEQDDPTVALNFPEPEQIRAPLLSFEGVTLGYGDKTVLKNLNGSLDQNERIALLGSNGNGKTTFARFLAGDLAPLAGILKPHPKLRIAFYRQDKFAELETTRTAYNLIADLLPNSTDQQIRAHLGRFGFVREKAMQKIAEFSGGEQARLLFACLTAKTPNLLILDEPTNHLDMEMRESLVASINAYQGAVILITHDRHLLQQVADRLWIVKNGSIEKFEGDLAEYEKSV